MWLSYPAIAQSAIANESIFLWAMKIIQRHKSWANGTEGVQEVTKNFQNSPPIVPIFAVLLTKYFSHGIYPTMSFVRKYP